MNRAIKCAFLVVGAFLSISFQAAAQQETVTPLNLVDPDSYVKRDIQSLLETQGDWGATENTGSDRPDRSWITAFSAAAATEVTVVGADNIAIENAIAQCGVGFCNIKVSNTITLIEPFELTRSKTRLFSDNQQKILSDVDDAFFSVTSNTSEVIIENLELDGRLTNYLFTLGVSIYGEGIDKVLLKGNKIHRFVSADNAHAVAVYGIGTTEASAIRNIIVEDNSVLDMQTGSSESIVINGNVTNWEIKNNTVTNVNNIAIDAIGGEGTSPVVIMSGRILPSPFDAARFGFIEGNTVTNMSTVTNPAYDNEHSWAAAYYVDGGRNITLDGNVATNTPWGFEVGSENCLVSRDILLENNTTSGSWGTGYYRFGDMLFGGYAEIGYQNDLTINCDPNNTLDANEGHGNVSHVTARNNTISNSPPGFDDGPTGGELLDRVTIQNRTTHTVLVDLGVTPMNENGDGSATGDNNAIRLTETTPLTCNGLTVTVDLGSGGAPTSGDDVIVGTAGDDVIFAMGGNDVICGLAGDDDINGGRGEDWIDAGVGDDTVQGANDNDEIYGDDGIDTLFGGPGNDVIYGEAGDDFIKGNSGDDSMFGGTGIDKLLGGSGHDTIYTGSGGNVGTVQSVAGGDGDDEIFGGPDADEIRGEAGADTINGSGGNDRLYGGGGVDIINGQSGDDLVRGNGAADLLKGGSGNDQIDGLGGNDEIYGGSGSDTLTGSTGDDRLYGESDNDSLDGGGGNDVLDGGAHVDECDGAGGTSDAAFNCETEMNIP